MITKTTRTLFLAGLTFVFFSCSSYQTFPTSEKVPGATIEAKVETDEFDNSIVYLKAESLAAADRLSPEKQYYVLWAASSNGAILNLGKIRSSSDNRVRFMSLTPYKLTELFITAEENPLLLSPKGIEIARMDLNVDYE